ncbi:transposase [Pseudomonas veronii]|uniref:Transposase n=1 Tax=Pseudomonas veronii TaxID=76761 RepID=A0ABS0VQI4_PSEVE|nr:MULTISPECIES: transposase [Pseudomonas fluorescens group]MBI6555690.1 transposase [Pseudomonas veronii]MBI6653809.1 transposase [Pseudomonas veronii]MBS4089752.1 transposase [Pseudomonas rustica]
MTCIGIGIDVSKATLDISVHRHKKPLRTTNDPAGWKQAIAWMQPFEPTQVVLEATGGYEQDALDAFYSAGLPIIRVNPRQARDFAKAMGQLAKTDHLDARMLAHMASVIELHRYQPRTDQAQELHAYHQRRQQLVQMISAEKQRRRLTRNAVLLEGLERHITQMESDRAELDKIIAGLLQGTMQAQVASTIKGMGPVAVSTLVCEMGELGYLNRKAIARLYGMAPLSKDSGQFSGKRTTWAGRRAPRSAMYMACLSAVRYDPVLKPFYQRLVANGKPKKVALVAAARKLVTMLNARMREALKAAAHLA